MRDNGRVAVPRMTDLVYLGQDGRLVITSSYRSVFCETPPALDAGTPPLFLPRDAYA